MNNYENYENHENTEHEAGQLLINPNAIHDSGTNHDNINSIGHEIAPFLFLENMTQIEENRITQNDERVENTRTQVFLSENQDGGFNTDELVGTLFHDWELQTNPNTTTQSQISYHIIPTWLLVVGWLLILTFLIGIAMILGQKMAGVIHKNKDTQSFENSEDFTYE